MKPTCDLYDEFRDTLGVLPPGLVHFGGRGSFHGPAVTVKCFEDNSRIKDYVGQPGEGRVIVVDAAASLRRAVLGDVVAGEAAANGWAGIVIWGAVRDRLLLADLDFGVMALGTTPRSPIRRDDGQKDLVISLGGTEVAPGDLIVTDADGAVVISKDMQWPDLT